MAEKQSVLPGANDLLQLAACPVQVIEHPSWTAARDAALTLLAAGPCVIVLLGPPGSGKTMLLRNLEVALSAQGRTACLLDFGDSERDLGLAEIVLVDEADRISAARLDELSLSEQGARALVLAALPAAGERFRRYPGAIVVEFATLSPDQACAFLAERLAQLGLPVRCLTEGAWAGLVAHGHGVPRLLIGLLGLALFVAAEDDAEQVTGAHVDQAVAVRIGGTEPAAIESIGSEAEPAGSDAPGLPAPDPPAKAATDAVSMRRRRGWSAPVAVALLAVCVLIPGALLTGGQNQEAGRPKPRDSVTQAVPRVAAAAPAAVAPDRVAQTEPPVATAPAAATADAAPNHPVSSPAGPINATVDASRPVVPSAPATASPTAPPMTASATTNEPVSQAVTRPGPASAGPTVSPPLASTAEDEPAVQPVTPSAPAATPPVYRAEGPVESPAPATVASGSGSQQSSPTPLVPVAAATPKPELPAGVRIRIVLVYPRGDQAAAQRGRDLAQALRSEGFGVGDPFPVASRAARRGISYYFAQDEDAAGEIGRRLGDEYGGGKLVRPLRGAGLPRPGTIEIAVGSG